MSENRRFFLKSALAGVAALFGYKPAPAAEPKRILPDYFTVRSLSIREDLWGGKESLRLELSCQAEKWTKEARNKFRALAAYRGFHVMPLHSECRTEWRKIGDGTVRISASLAAEVRHHAHLEPLSVRVRKLIGKDFSCLA